MCALDEWVASAKLYPNVVLSNAHGHFLVEDGCQLTLCTCDYNNPKRDVRRAQRW